MNRSVPGGASNFVSVSMNGCPANSPARVAPGTLSVPVVFVISVPS
jgi:hypothetical protein